MSLLKWQHRCSRAVCGATALHKAPCLSMHERTLCSNDLRGCLLMAGALVPSRRSGCLDPYGCMPFKCHNSLLGLNACACSCAAAPALTCHCICSSPCGHRTCLQFMLSYWRKVPASLPDDKYDASHILAKLREPAKLEGIGLGSLSEHWGSVREPRPSERHSCRHSTLEVLLFVVALMAVALLPAGLFELEHGRLDWS